MTTITAEELESARFSVSRDPVGYRPEDVDRFLDEAVACLRRGEDPAELARSAAFGVVKRGGYDPQQVDDLLDRLAGAPGGVPSAQPAAASPAIEPLPEEPGLLARLFGWRR